MTPTLSAILKNGLVTRPARTARSRKLHDSILEERMPTPCSSCDAGFVAASSVVKGEWLGMTIEIKLLGLPDAGLLARVAPGVFDHPIDAERAAEFLADPRHHLAVAIEQDVVVGFVSAVHSVHPDKPRPELWINEVAVAATHRGRGLGTGLLRALFARARELGCGEAWVLTDRSNTAAMRLYATAGNADAPSDHVMFTFKLNSDKPPEGSGGEAVSAGAESVPK
jgi:GNAT superfamily N-acetyltransferase